MQNEFKEWLFSVGNHGIPYGKNIAYESDIRAISRTYYESELHIYKSLKSFNECNRLLDKLEKEQELPIKKQNGDNGKRRGDYISALKAYIRFLESI